MQQYTARCKSLTFPVDRIGFHIPPKPSSNLNGPFSYRHVCQSRLSSRTRACKELQGPGGPADPPKHDAGEGGEGGDHGGQTSEEQSILLEEVCNDAEDVIVLDVSGMHCGSCASRVRRLLEGHPDVSQANVNLTTEVALVRVQLPRSEEGRKVSKSRSSTLQAIAVQLIQVLTENGFKAGVRSSKQSNAAAAAIVQSRREERISQ